MNCRVCELNLKAVKQTMLLTHRVSLNVMKTVLALGPRVVEPSPSSATCLLCDVVQEA